jgi:hypothetical protein
VKPLEDIIGLLEGSFEKGEIPEKASVRSPPCGTSSTNLDGLVTVPWSVCEI